MKPTQLCTFVHRTGNYYVHDAETGAEIGVEFTEILEPPYQLVTRAIPDSSDPIIKEKSYTLTEENGGTRFIVTLLSYEPEPDTSRSDHMEQDSFGFGMALQNAKAYLEGEGLPYPFGF